MVRSAVGGVRGCGFRQGSVFQIWVSGVGGCKERWRGLGLELVMTVDWAKRDNAWDSGMLWCCRPVIDAVVKRLVRVLGGL